MFQSDIHIARDMTKRHHWTLTKPLVWDDGETHITVPEGFEFDFASVPWFLQWWLPKVGMRYDRASCLHDYLYETQPCTRLEADTLFYKAMLSDRVPKARARIMYRAVRAGGWRYWNKRVKELSDN